MIVVVFRSRLAPDVDLSAYQDRVDELFRQAQAMPGFRSIRDYGAEDGERLAVIEFDTEAELEAWRNHADHRLAQAAGRERLFTEYHLQVCRQVRESHFRRGD